MSRRGGKITFVLIAILVTAIIGGLVSVIFSRFVVGDGGVETKRTAGGAAAANRPAVSALPEGGGAPDTTESQ
jgi:hypothetical protein